MKFEEAMKKVREGYKVRRKNWAKEFYVGVMVGGFLRIINGKRSLEPEFSIGDMNADDWETVNDWKLSEQKEKECDPDGLEYNIYLESDVRECRDEILKDIEKNSVGGHLLDESGVKHLLDESRAKEIVKKWFGDV